MCPTVIGPTIEGHFIVPYGLSDVTSIYINEVRYDTIIDFYFEKRTNQVGAFNFKIVGLEEADKANVDEGKIVKAFSNSTLFFKGTITECEYGTDGFSTINGEGMEWTLKKKSVDNTASADSDSPTNRPIYTNKTTATIVSEQCSGYMGVGTNVSLGSVSVRGDYSNKLEFLARVINDANGEWWISQSGISDSYNTDYFNASTARGTGVSVYTFNVSGANANAIRTKNQTDLPNFANVVNCIGGGGGISQWESKAFHATTNRTYLNGAITATATSITVDDNTAFPASGNIWLGMEKIAYSSKPNSTTFTVSARGTAGTLLSAYAHNDNVEVVDAQYTTSSPQTGSSIQVNGLKETSFTDITIKDQNVLDLIAQNLLAANKNPVTHIELTASDPRAVLDVVNLGDTVTITDSDASLSGNYKIDGIIFEFSEDGGLEKLTLSAANEKPGLLLSLSGTTTQQMDNMKYGQGSVFYSIPIYENCADTDSSTYLDLRFYIPPQVIRVEDVKLNFKFKGYRTYNGLGLNDGQHPPAGDGGHSHVANLVNPTLTGQSVGIYTGIDGGSMTLFNTYTSDQPNLDLTSAISALGNNTWVDIQFRPNKHLRIEAVVYIQALVENR